MAITPAACQTALGTNVMNARILKADEGGGGTYQYWYVQGNVDAPGRCRWCACTASDNAATQAAAILVTLRA
jgi:hypothetical protein